MNAIVSNNIVLKKMDDTSFIDTYKESYITYLNTYIGSSKSKIINSLIRTYKTWDNYSLSIMFLELLNNNNSDNNNSDNNNSDNNNSDKNNSDNNNSDKNNGRKTSFIEHFYQLLMQNILPKRYSIEDTKRKFKDIIYL
jgi:hypothetical protein